MFGRIGQSQLRTLGELKAAGILSEEGFHKEKLPQSQHQRFTQTEAPQMNITIANPDDYLYATEWASVWADNDNCAGSSNHDRRSSGVVSTVQQLPGIHPMADGE
jgi:hypothetical protein